MLLVDTGVGYDDHNGQGNSLTAKPNCTGDKCSGNFQGHWLELINESNSKLKKQQMQSSQFSRIERESHAFQCKNFSCCHANTSISQALAVFSWVTLPCKLSEVPMNSELILFLHWHWTLANVQSVHVQPIFLFVQDFHPLIYEV